MPETQPAFSPPTPPEKPIRSKKWGLIAGGSVIGLFVFLDLLTSIHVTSSRPPTTTHNRQPQTPVSPATLQGFERETKQMAEDLQHRREALQAAIEKARGVDLGRLLTPLPECNQAMREKLSGRYYVTATAQGEPVRLACEDNDQWAVIPEAAVSIQPLTPQQEQAMNRTPQSSGQSPAERRKQEEERKRREALDCSSVALDFAQAVQQQEKTPAKKASDSETPTTQELERREVAEEKRKDATANDEKPKYDWDAYVGPLYRVFEGSVIESVLTNRLYGEFTGPVNVMVATDLYSHDHQHILLPQGTRILGEATKVSVQQQRRLAVVFHRAILPDGYSVDFDRFAGLDQQGATGLTGRVDTHWAKVIGTAVLVGAIGGLAQVGAYGGTYGPGAAIQTGIGAQTSQQAVQILDRALNVLPTVTVYEGTRVRIWVAHDAELPAYENHRVNPSL
jgi:type IV secretion system protein VirB10